MASKAVVAAPPSQELSKLDASNFKMVLDHCDKKKYAKCVAVCDKILGRNPHHGETMVMKALAMSNQPESDKKEYWELARAGVRINPKSHICWHVLGLLHRADRQYAEAIKCFQKAVKIEPSGSQMRTELGSMQLVVGDYRGFCSTRKALLRQHSGNDTCWVAFVVGLHLSGQVKTAAEILASYLDAMGDNATDDTYALNELHLYRNDLLREAGMYEEALGHANKFADAIRDTTALNEAKAECLMQLKRMDEARAILQELQDENPEKIEYHHRIWVCAGLVASEQEARRPPAASEAALAELHAAVAAKHPRAALSSRLPLTFLTGDAFRAAADAYMRRFISKGIPSLHRDIADLYDSPERKATIADLAESYVRHLRESGTFDGAAGAKPEAPSALMFALYLLAQHLDVCGDHQRALEVVAEAIAHTPTAMDLYVLQARIYSHAGDADMAYACMDRARALDTADRYLNIKTVKYALRAGRLAEAEKTVQMFLRDDDVLVKTLDDLQMSWYQLDAGDMFVRQGRRGRALRMYANVDAHFDTTNEAQLDFFNYCWRRAYVRAATDVARWCATAREHPFFYEAATGLTKVYLSLHRTPQSGEDDDKEAAATASEEQKRKEADPELAGLCKEERRKVLRARRKAAYRDLDEADAEAKVDADEKKRSEAEKAAAESDVEGAKLLAVKSALNEAVRHVRQLVQFCGDRVGSHTLAMETYLEKGRPLLVLQALRRARAIDADDARLHVLTARLLVALDEAAAKASDEVNEVVRQERAELDLEDPAAFAAAFVKAHSGSMEHRLAAAEASHVLGRGAPLSADAVALASDLSGNGVTHALALRAVEFLRGAGAGDAADKLLARARDRFPLAVALMTGDALAARDAKLAETLPSSEPSTPKAAADSQ